MNIWDERYGGQDYIYGTKPNEFFREELQKIPPGIILLPAEGEGRNAVHAALENWNVFAIDLSIEGQKKALKLAKQYNVQINYDVSDLTEYNFPEEKFDAIALIYTHLPESIRKTVHTKLLNSLKVGGILIFEAFSTEQLQYTSGGPKTLELLYTPEMVKEDFQSLQFIHFEKTITELSEGEYHKGIAHVIRLVAEK